MPNFIFAYYGGKMPETPEEGAKAMAAWEAWFGDLGEAIVDPGNPVGQSRTVTATTVADDGGSNPLSGYSIVRATNLDKAVEMAQRCPMVADGSGSVEVAEVHELSA